jgi:hypothetical protein
MTPTIQLYYINQFHYTTLLNHIPMGSRTRFSTHSAEIPHTFPNGMEYFSPVWNIFPHTFPTLSPRYEIQKSLDIILLSHYNDSLERYE